MALFSNNRRLSLLVSATLSSWAIVTAPSLAANVPTITFNSNNYKTFTPSGATINNATAAQTALLDNAPAATNVELWYTTEDPTANVGFTFKQGAYEATVTSVTKSDWSLFGKKWFDDFLAVYTPAGFVLPQSDYDSALAYIQKNGVPRAGDPNIGSVKLDETTGEFSLDMVGHYDLVDRLVSSSKDSYNTTNGVIDGMLDNLATGATFARSTSGQQLMTALTTQANDIKTLTTTFSTTPTTANLTAIKTKLTQIKDAATTASTSAGLPKDIKKALTDLSTALGTLSLPSSVTNANRATVLGLVNAKMPELATALTAASSSLSALNKPLSMSEVAKVTSNGQTYFAYSFAAQQSGIKSSDGTESFTGIYKWSQKLDKSVSAASTPEPSILLGMMALGGSAIASRRKRNRA